MSRTDKDRPRWVSYGIWKPDHSLRCHSDKRVCDLPSEPPAKAVHPSTVHERYWWGCQWEREDEREVYRYSYHAGGVPRWFVLDVYHNVKRRKTRDQARRAIAEYRATGDVDVEFDVEQARNAAKWYFW